jgi:multicomponent Na+:H+ antiporter subunit A
MIATIPYLLLLLAVLGAMAPLLTKRLGHFAGILISLLPLALFVMLSVINAQLGDNEVRFVSTSWQLVPGAPLAFRFDGLSLIFGVMVSGIGFLVLNYSAGYMKGHPQIGRFFMLMTLFMVAMLGMVMSENLITLFFFGSLPVFGRLCSLVSTTIWQKPANRPCKRC